MYSVLTSSLGVGVVQLYLFILFPYKNRMKIFLWSMNVLLLHIFKIYLYFLNANGSWVIMQLEKI